MIPTNKKQTLLAVFLFAALATFGGCMELGLGNLIPSGSENAGDDGAVTGDDGSAGNGSDDGSASGDDGGTGVDDSPGTDDGTGDQGGANAMEARFRGELSGDGSASGQAVWRIEADRFVFRVEVESGVPGDVLEIVADGFVVGELALNEFGFGEAEFQSPPDNNPSPNEFELPDGFPLDLGAGASIAVGDLTGELAAE